jgi:hypothetical protein
MELLKLAGGNRIAGVENGDGARKCKPPVCFAPEGVFLPPPGLRRHDVAMNLSNLIMATSPRTDPALTFLRIDRVFKD